MVGITGGAIFIKVIIDIKQFFVCELIHNKIYHLVTNIILWVQKMNETWNDKTMQKVPINHQRIQCRNQVKHHNPAIIICAPSTHNFTFADVFVSSFSSP